MTLQLVHVGMLQDSKDEEKKILQTQDYKANGFGILMAFIF